MRARVLAVLLLLAALPAQPQCNFTPVLSDPFRSSILDLAIDGSDLWAATSYGLSLYDRSIDPPRLIASLAISGTTRLVRLGNGLVYVGSGNAIAVVRKNGRGLQLLRTVDAGAPVNDLVVTTLALYVATGNGIAQYDLIDPTNPHLTPLTFQTSQTAVTSLALIGSTLYAADGDPSVEIFNITIPTAPQRAGAIDAQINAVAVHVNNSKLYVSSLLQTNVYIGGTLAGTVPFSIISLAPISGDAVFAASSDRTLRGIDFTTPGIPIDIYRDELPPSGGTINRVTALATSGGRLYAGAGDIGIADYDISTFAAPYPMRSYSLAGASSVVSLGDNFYIGMQNGVTEFTQGLVRRRSWDGSRSDTVHDGTGGFLLTSSGTSMTLWVLGTQIPSIVATANLRARVVSAALVGTVGYAVLSDRTLWRADFADTQPTPTQITTPRNQPASVARSANSLAIAEALADGTTLVSYYSEIGSVPKSVSIPGLTTTGVTLSNATAAIQTFRGISLIDFANDTTVVLPQSNDVIARQLLLSGTTLLELTDTTLRVWNTQTRTVSANVTLPAPPTAMHVAPQSMMADVATSAGAVAIALDGLSRMPSKIDAPNANAFYKKIVASSTRLVFFDGRNAELYTSALHYVGSVRAGGIVDVAANDSGVFTVTGNLTVTAYSPDGVFRSTAVISEGPDAQAQSITTVNGAVWVSLLRGCTIGACEKKTIVFDSKLNQTMAMSGAVVDVVSNANRAYAITDVPAEIRVINLADPAHPSIVASRAAEGTPVSIAYASGMLYVLGNTLATYNETSLTKVADLLGPYFSDGTVTFADQHVRIDGNCAIVTGRSFAPQLFTLPQWTPSPSFATPSAARTLSTQPGLFYVLTDHSLEIWSTAPLPKPPRRAPAR